MLSLSSVSKSFGGVEALDDVSLEVGPGEVHGLIGPNGAGKTTLINLVSGVYRADTGTIALDGQDIGRLPSHRRAALGLARTFQNLRLFPNLTVEQNIAVAEITGAGSGRSRAAGTAESVKRFDLADKLHLPGSDMSYGHMRRLEIVRALALRPKAMLLDEPAAGMNAMETGELISGLHWIRERCACSILVIDHDLKFIMGVCDRITVLTQGRILASGMPEEVSRQAEVIEAYLGHGT